MMGTGGVIWNLRGHLCVHGKAYLQLPGSAVGMQLVWQSTLVHRTCGVAGARDCSWRGGAVWKEVLVALGRCRNCCGVLVGLQAC